MVWFTDLICKYQMCITFLCSAEKAVQQVAMFLRSVPNWEVVEPLPEIGGCMSIVECVCILHMVFHDLQ